MLSMGSHWQVLADGSKMRGFCGKDGGIVGARKCLRGGVATADSLVPRPCGGRKRCKNLKMAWQPPKDLSILPHLTPRTSQIGLIL